MDAESERDARIDATADELKEVGNEPAIIDLLAASAKALKPGEPVRLPGRPFCVGFVSNGVSETLDVGVTASLDNMSGAIFSAPGYMLERRILAGDDHE